jgi:hypothetical protein
MVEQSPDPRSPAPRAPLARAPIHRSTVAALANDLHVNEAEVLDAYESELGQFVDARIQMFVPVLVAKRVRRKLLGLN